MLLIPHRISCSDQCAKAMIYLADISQLKMMNVISWRNCLYLGKPFILSSGIKHQMTYQVILPHRDGGEGHSSLEPDACLAGNNCDWSIRLYGLPQGRKQFFSADCFVAKMGFERLREARMRLVQVCKSTLAARALPKLAVDPFNHRVG